MGSARAQGQLWGRHPEIWSTKLEQKMRPFFLTTLEAIGPLDGAAMLDVGCGAGQAICDAAARGATVSGLDATAPLLAIAARRTPAADLRQGDIEALPFKRRNLRHRHRLQLDPVRRRPGNAPSPNSLA